MTAKSRRRKANQRLKRSNDVKPQPQDVRRPQEDGVRGHAPTHIVIDEARLRSVHVVNEGEGLGYILEVGTEAHRKALEFKHGTAHLLSERLETESGRSLWNELIDRDEAEVRAKAASDAATGSERGLEEAAAKPFFEQLHEVEALVEEANREAHEAFYEAELEGVAGATHIVKEDCYCGQNVHHWKDLGEN